MRERLNEPLRVRILPNIALFYILSTIFSSQAFGQVGSDGKVLPAKGDSNCPSLAERYNEFMNNKTPSVWYNPCNEIPAPPLEVPDNGIVLQIFLSLPAFGEELGTSRQLFGSAYEWFIYLPCSHTKTIEYYFTMVVKWAIVGYLNEASAEYNVKLDTTIPSLDALFNGSNRHPNPAFQAEVVLQNTTTQIVQRHDASWWWSYQIIFYCFWGNANPRKSGQPLMNNTTLRKVEQDLNRYLREGIEIFDSFDFPVLSRGILGLSVIDPRDSATPFQDGPPTEPPKSTPSHTPDGFVPVPPTDAEDKKTRGSFSNTLLHSTYSTPIDSHFWVRCLRIFEVI